MKIQKSPPELDPKTIKKLHDIFYSDEFGMRNAYALYKEAVKQKINVSFQDIKRGFYDLQEVNQMFSPLKKPTASKVPIVGRYVGERVFFDTMYFPRNKIAIINGFDLHSKYAWGKPIRLISRADETTQSVDSRKGATFIQEVMLDLNKKGYTLDSVVCDAGSEWLGEAKAYLAREGIPQDFAEPGDHLALGPIDGYTRGLRLAAERWLTTNPGKDLYKHVAQLIETYNNTIHSTIKMTPDEALGKIGPVYKRDIKDDREPSELKEGDTVRVITRNKDNPRKKIRANWSRNMYKIIKANLVSRQFKLDNGRTYREFELLLIPFPDRVMRYEPPEAPPKEKPAPREKVPIEPRVQPSRDRKTPNYLIDYV
jgi:hypothetical protein